LTTAVAMTRLPLRRASYAYRIRGVVAKESIVKAHCPNCSSTHDVSTAVGRKIAAALVGAAVGQAATRSPFAAVCAGLLGLVIGEVIERTIIPRCPACGVALQVIAATL
jgi:predicted RNA-binding Zn-ribbon protein involved in translation (DUF1610 family)